MKFSLSLLTVTVYLTSLIAAAPPSSSPHTDLSTRDASPLESYNALEKRKGGGGGRGGSGGGSGGGGRGGYSYSGSSMAGGRTISGSGTPKAYGNRYTGGAVVPYTAGASSPTRGIAPYALGVGALAFFPGLWLYSSVYAYPYGYPYHWYYNGQNHTSNVTCLCQRYQVCGCDPTDNSTFLDEVILNGTAQPVNSTNVRTVDFGNGSVSTFINGSLENGTTADGGTDPSNDEQASPAVKVMIDFGGYWIMVATVVTGMWMAA
ncbi:hypothetical protein LTR84_006143 [Exophiala bonariae]|uniref:DUF7732 domain-containing protein n=1 Tax=Exophiala bonariae TaxID=1690606 RepID=A0AAV9N3V1_9EURO|nr:hypothetical protein LTR84_006143 [Exophiala bonariae]